MSVKLLGELCCDGYRCETRVQAPVKLELQDGVIAVEPELPAGWNTQWMRGYGAPGYTEVLCPACMKKRSPEEVR